MKRNQMKFVRDNDNCKMKFLDVQFLDLNDFSPIGFNVLGKNEIAVALESDLKNVNFQIIDMKEVKRSLRKIWNQWFPIGNKNAPLMVGVFWTAFMTYIFPWCMDIAKVYCCWKIIQGFYAEGKGMDGKGGKSGFATLLQYGKWYIALSLIPWSVTLIDEVAHQMGVQLMKVPVNLPTSK